VETSNVDFKLSSQLQGVQEKLVKLGGWWSLSGWLQWEVAFHRLSSYSRASLAGVIILKGKFPLSEQIKRWDQNGRYLQILRGGPRHQMF
jgi:hypothetical protein